MLQLAIFIRAMSIRSRASEETQSLERTTSGAGVLELAPDATRDTKLFSSSSSEATHPVFDRPNQAAVVGAGNVLLEARVRATWLIGLLFVQSLSGVIIDDFRELVKEHVVVTLFLTMLVGAGGNSGAQSAVHVIRGLAIGTLHPTRASFVLALKQQFRVSLLLAAALSVGGFVRVFATEGDALDALAIAIALFVIVVCGAFWHFCASNFYTFHAQLAAVLVGTSLPFCLVLAGLDPANAGTSVQVVMDGANAAH